MDMWLYEVEILEMQLFQDIWVAGKLVISWDGLIIAGKISGSTKFAPQHGLSRDAGGQKSTFRVQAIILSSIRYEVDGGFVCVQLT